MFKMHNEDGATCDVDKDQVPAMKEAGWKLGDAPASDADEAPEGGGEDAPRAPPRSRGRGARS